jgi:predicted metal-dependent peptidase
MKDVHEEISRCIIQMLFKEPFFNHLLSGLVRVVSEEVPTAAVSFSGTNINLLVNETFFLKELRSQSNRVAVIKHEALHLLFKHLFRTDIKNYEPTLFNIAADLVVNQFIGSWKLPEGAVTLDTFPDLGLEQNQTLEWYYKKLSKLQNSLPPSSLRNASVFNIDENTAPKSSEALSKIMEEKDQKRGDHSKWGTPPTAKGQIDGIAAETELDRMIIQARERTPAKYWGTIPGEINTLIDILIENRRPKVDWRRTLRIFSSNSRRTYIFSTMHRISKRYGTRPGIKVKQFQKVAVVIDTSGSVSDDDIAVFFTEIHAMYRSGAEILVIECDSEVGETYKYDGRLPTEVSGRGGTEFDPAFAFLRSNRLTHFDGCIYLTDGYAAEPTIKPPCPLLWVITPDGDDGDHLLFGRVIKLPA